MSEMLLGDIIRAIIMACAMAWATWPVVKEMWDEARLVEEAKEHTAD